MTRSARVFVTVVIAAVVGVTAALGVTAAAVLRAGTVAVSIEEAGNQIDLRVPAGLVRVAVALTPAVALDDVADELEPFLPALAAGWQELSDAPDFVIVTVESSSENVRVRKSGRHLEVAIDAPDTRVRVAVPLATVDSLLRKLDRS